MDCFCGRDAVYFLQYARRHLCPEHFIEMFDRRFRRAVRKFRMIKKNDLVAVGLSGGKDSTVLLHSLVQLQKDLPFELVAITIDEGIKDYREKTIEVAKRECEKLGIRHRTYSFRDASGKTLDEIIDKGEELPCSHCGVMRRYLLNKAAREAKADKLAIGHNLDDLAQTILMNIMRKEPSRLARINEPLVNDPQFVRRIKPMMLIPEKEVAAYAMLKGIEMEHLECPYANTALRQDVRRLLNQMEEKHPGTKFKIAASFFEIEDALQQKYGKNVEIRRCVQCGEPAAKDRCMYCRKIRELTKPES